MTWKRVAVRTVSEVCAWKRGIFGPRLGFRILLYHAVGSHLLHDTYGISIRSELFERHMAVLSRQGGISIVGLEDKPLSSAGLRVAITFDDGYQDNLKTAAPILLKYKIPFTVFATSSYIQSGRAPYLNSDELRELASLPGASIGSHGATHIPLAECDDATLWRELYDSRCYLEDVIKKPVQGIAYPHGSVSVRVMEAAQRAGYTLGGCSRFDINDVSRDPLLLYRSEIVAADSERIFLQKLYGAWDWYRWRIRDLLVS